MSLRTLINNEKTDKNTTHSYLDTYESLFHNKKNVSNVLEIGIQKGGSIQLWKDYFNNANIYGVDILSKDSSIEYLNQERIILYTDTDAYNFDFVEREFINKNITFDIVIDDGPHTLESMIKFIQIYHKSIKNDGILIIEDVQDMEWVKQLKEITPNHLQNYIKIFDLRYQKGRYDDILFVIDLSCNQSK